jgi:hypothetical protein
MEVVAARSSETLMNIYHVTKKYNKYYSDRET